MTTPHDDLLTLATAYALDAVDDAERADIERRVQAAPEEVSAAFAVEVREVREAMAAVSSTTAAEPPAQLRERLIATVSAEQTGQVRQLRPPRRRWSTAVAAAAAAVVIGVATFGVGWWLRPVPTETTAEQIFAAPDVRTVSGQIPTGGTATVVFSRERNAGVLVMNNVEPPTTGTVYQMWLIDTEGAHSAGVMDAGAIAPSTTAVLPDLGSSTTLAFTVEPGSGSDRPTTTPFASLPLS
ncbi:anti-sigma factor [Mycolicibacterium frederiksbergense]|uniref:anti-sigma factor n=1 Tax=Mycolicibacterium frederiksbergense TaxID=117567 RepID=UPI00265C716D|nr:anti-sigma factor [Mycolicibacterium frederiksbergense]MBX9918960.1 anti-sigma factor [Mycolicibacterium frederiksbergense]MDO0974984.1 anti-sigma factor [Mycolicibacterium frederiksbergense]